METRNSDTQIFSDAGLQLTSQILGKCTDFYQQKLSERWGVFNNEAGCQSVRKKSPVGKEISQTGLVWEARSDTGKSIAELFRDHLVYGE